MAIFEGGFFGDAGANIGPFANVAPSGQKQDVFMIEELTGAKRQIQLRGRGLPYRPVAWGGTQRVVTTYYPGNPDATQQVLGPTDKNTDVKGMWKIRYVLGDGVFIRENGQTRKVTKEGPEKIRDLMESIGRSGQLLKVTWGGIVRQGRLADWNFPHDRLEDIGFELSFVWKNRGEKIKPANANVKKRNISLLQSILSAVMEAVGALTSVLDAVDNLKQNIVLQTRKVQAAVFRANQLVERINSAVRAPVDITNGIIAAMVDIRAQVRATSAQVSRTPAELMSLSDSPAQFLDVFTSIVDARNEMNLVGREAYRQEAIQLAQVRPQYLDVVVGVAGQSLRDLARRYYGDPGAWTIIADANGLDSSTLEGGEILIIPVRS